MSETTVVATGTERIEPTMGLRFVGKNGTTTAPRILQQAFAITRYDLDGRAVSQRMEWRDVPLHLED